MSELQKAFDALGVKSDGGSPSSDFVERRIKVGDSFITVSDRISKAAVLGNIGMVIKNLEIEKTGKEVKDAINKIKAIDESEAAKYYMEAQGHLKSCVGTPDYDNHIDEWDLKGTKLKFGDVPKGFKWEVVNDWEKAERQSSDEIQLNGMGVEAAKHEYSESLYEKNPYRKYNQAIRKYVQCRVEALLLDTIASNLDDKKKYKLDAEQAVKLGF